MKQIFLMFFAVALMTGCGSSVKLDGAPVEDKTGTALSATEADGRGGSAVGNSGVVPVEIETNNKNVALPAGSRVVYFDYDSFVIKPEFQSVIEVHARFIKTDKARKVAIEGHTDERGGREYNLALGQKRSEAVRSALGLLGVADNQLEAVSFGKEKPAVSGSDEAAMAKNRRAEISYR